MAIWFGYFKLSLKFLSIIVFWWPLQTVFYRFGHFNQIKRKKFVSISKFLRLKIKFTSWTLSWNSLQFYSNMSEKFKVLTIQSAYTYLANALFPNWILRFCEFGFSDVYIQSILYESLHSPKSQSATFFNQHWHTFYFISQIVLHNFLYSQFCTMFWKIMVYLSI